MTANTKGVGYASGDTVKSMGDFLNTLTETSLKSGWHIPHTVIEHGEGEESIVIGVRWLPAPGQYVAEIR